MVGASEEDETDGGSERSRPVELAGQVVGWLRDVHRGFAGTGHFPYQED